MEHSLCLPVYFCFYQLGLCSVSYTTNEYSICHFCVIIKDFFISFSRVIIVQDFETVTFYQEIDVQIQAFTDENWNILHSCFFERY